MSDYKIDETNYKSKSSLWDTEAETLLALFVKRLCKIRPELNFNKVSKEILENYVRKTSNGQVSATKIMREIRDN